MGRKVLLILATAVLHAINTTANVLSLRRANAQPPGSQALTYQNTNGGASPLRSAGQGKGYALDLNMGGQTFNVLLDTASSDIWVPKSTFQCVIPPKLATEFTQRTGERPECHVGPAYSGTFSDGSIVNQHMNISYGSGEYLIGEVGYEDVSLGGIKVPNQIVGLADYGFYTAGDDVSGMVGFGYPTMTSAFEGTNPGGDKPGVNQAPYNPFFFNAAQQGLCEPYFSLALERTGDSGPAGQLVMGSLPNVRYNSNAWARAPFRILPVPAPLKNIIPQELQTEYTFYTIFPDGFLLQGQTYPFSTQGDFDPSKDTVGVDLPMIVDSGTSLTLVPPPIMEGIAAAFNPPAQFNANSSVYEVDCRAVAPRFAVRIGGVSLWMAKEDMLLSGEAGIDPDTGMCVLGVQKTLPGGPNVLGDTFLKNVVSVFDVGGKEMRFAQRL